MNDFQTRTTRLLEELRADLNTTMDAQCKPKLKQIDSFQCVIGLDTLSSSEKLTLQAIIQRKNSGNDVFSNKDLRQVIPFSRVVTSRYLKKLLELNFISRYNNDYRYYTLNEKEIY